MSRLPRALTSVLVIGGTILLGVLAIAASAGVT
jgi:hypothetical protein